MLLINRQWFKCYRTQGTSIFQFQLMVQGVPPPQITIMLTKHTTTEKRPKPECTAHYTLQPLWTGHVIGVETLDVPVQKDGGLDCGLTRWTENNVSDLPYAFALRVFFNAEINGRLYGCDKCHIGQFQQVFALVYFVWRVRFYFLAVISQKVASQLDRYTFLAACHFWTLGYAEHFDFSLTSVLRVAKFEVSFECFFVCAITVWLRLYCLLFVVYHVCLVNKDSHCNFASVCGLVNFFTCVHKTKVKLFHLSFFMFFFYITA